MDDSFDSFFDTCHLVNDLLETKEERQGKLRGRKYQININFKHNITKEIRDELMDKYFLGKK